MKFYTTHQTSLKPFKTLPVMNPFTKIFAVCCSNRADPPSHQDVELDTLEPKPAPIPTPAPAPSPIPAPAYYPLAHFPRYHSATFSPRMLAPLSKTADFSDGGDARRLLATFSASWADAPEDRQSVVHEFVYEGECGRTWPLRRVRVDGRVGEDDEEEEEEYELEAEAEAGEVAGLEESVGEEELEATMIDNGTVKISRPMHVETDDDIVRIARVTPTTTEDITAKVSTLTDEATDNCAVRISRPAQVVSTQTVILPKKLRIRIRRPAEGVGSEEPPVKLFKVRIRAPQELENEDMRGLPVRRDASLVTDNPDGDTGRAVYGVLVPKAATVPYRKTLEVVRKDSARNARWRRIL
jgi:hypothetical protein